MQTNNTEYKNNLSIHLFRNDLRLTDNSALLAALNESRRVITCYAIDYQNIFDFDNLNFNSFEFMINSLKELSEKIAEKGGKLYIFNKKIEEVIEDISKKIEINSVYINRDYTPISQMTDQKLKEICSIKGIPVNIFSDFLLTEPEIVKKSDGTPYTVFTAFRNKAKVISIQKPNEKKYNNYFNEEIGGEISIDDLEAFAPNSNNNLKVKGGRSEGIKLIDSITNLNDYDATRNIPSIQGTSLLSAHLRFGTVSVREVYWKICDEFNENHTLINELYWRDFFTHVAYHFPRVLTDSFNQRFTNLKWENDHEKFNRWCTGTTGFPIVDAGMRELNTTGYMHNRVRMITASFLTKDLHIDWKKGEKYFAQKLIDFDPSVNNGNWQWAASTGCDAQPWFRIFNPWLQQQKFDRDCIYIKRWLPELKNFTEKQIHNIPLANLSTLQYPTPVVDHKTESANSKFIYSSI